MTRLLIAALFLAIVVLAFEAGRASAYRPTLGPAQSPVAMGANPGAERTGAPLSVPPTVPGGTPAPPSSGISAAGHTISGTASWGYGWSGAVTRLRRGTPICVTGPLGRWCGRSVGYGPAKWTGRIVDLSASLFRELCGPLSRGLCTVRLSW